MSTDVQVLRSPAMQRLLGRAAIYQLLALALAYPDREAVETLDLYLADLSAHPTFGELGLEPRLRAVVDARPRVSEAEHTRLFAGAVVCSPYETAYVRQPFARSRQLADIAGFYEAFGLRPAEGSRARPPDFIATELEFMSLLLRKEAYASLSGWDDRRAVAADAARGFLEDHLGRWYEAFGDEIDACSDPRSFYVQVADLLRAFVAAEVAASGARPARLGPRGAVGADDGPLSCGVDPPGDREGASATAGENGSDGTHERAERS